MAGLPIDMRFDQPAFGRFRHEAKQMLEWEEDGSKQEDEAKIRAAWIRLGWYGRSHWVQWALHEPDTWKGDPDNEVRCMLTLARFLGTPIKAIERGRGAGRWVAFGRWSLKPLSGKDFCWGAVCQAAVISKRTVGVEGTDVTVNPWEWHPISEIMVAKLVEEEDPPLPDVADELYIHDLLTRAALREQCESIIHLRAGGVDTAREAYTVVTAKGGFGSLEQVIKRHTNVCDVPEAFIWYLINNLAQAALIMERGAVRYADQAWRKEIVHLDIRPANIVLHWPNHKHFHRYPTPKLIDFGLAIMTDDEDTKNPFSYGGRGAPDEIAPEMYWADHRKRRYQEDKNPLIGVERLTSRTNIWQIGLVAHTLMTCNQDICQEFDFDAAYEPEVEGGESSFEPGIPALSPQRVYDDTADADANPETEDDGMPAFVNGMDDGQQNYMDMGWREPHDVRIGGYSEELTRVVVQMLRFIPNARPNAAAVYTYTRKYAAIWKWRQANQPSRPEHELLYN